MMPIIHYQHSQYVITYLSFRRAIHANESNYPEIKTCLSERLQMSWHVTEIGASHTINTSLCVTYLTTGLPVSVFLTTELGGREETDISIILHEH